MQNTDLEAYPAPDKSFNEGEIVPDGMYYYAAEDGLVAPGAPQGNQVPDGNGYLRLLLDRAYFENERDEMFGILQASGQSWQATVPAPGSASGHRWARVKENE